MTVGNLEDGKGQNLLVFKKEKPDRENGEDSGVFYDRNATHTGFYGAIYNSKEKSSNYDVMHESLHFLGLSDWYDSRGPNKGYEKDIMGSNGNFTISINHYKNMLEFVNKSQAIQNKYIKLLYGDIVVDRWFLHGKGEGYLKR